MKRVGDIFVRFSDKKEKIINTIMDMFNGDINLYDDYSIAFDNIVKLSRESIEDNDMCVVVIGENYHTKDYFVDGFLVKQDVDYPASLVVEDWRNILNSHLVSDADLIVVAAFLLHMMTLVDFDEDKRKRILETYNI